MTPDEITSLIFTHNSVFGIQIQSRISQADCMFPVKVLPLALARQLHELKCPVWTIHFYPTHAELWLATHWTESHSRRLQIIHESNLRVQHYNNIQEGNSTLQELTFKVLTRMQQQGLHIGIGAAQLTAYAILTGTMPGESITELDLTDLYAQYGNKANTEQSRIADSNVEAEAIERAASASSEQQDQ